ncbi:MAG TPA: terminase family protein [Sphingomonas sp.]
MRRRPGSALKRLAREPRSVRVRLVRQMPAGHLRTLNEWWEFWAHEGQLWPKGDWRIWLIQAGRGFGKTRAGAEWVSRIARERPKARIALVGANFDEARRVMVEGPAGLLAMARDGERPRWLKKAGELHFDSGAIATVFSAEAPDGLRGPEHDAAWCDELGKWRGGPLARGELAWDNLMMGLRSGRAQVVVTTTPRTTQLMQRVKAMQGVRETRGRTLDNPHLPASFIDAMVAEYGGTRKGRQELDGELLDDIVGALWSRELIEARRVKAAPELVRVVIGVDPPGGSATPGGGDACGIVAVGLGRDGHGYVIEDASVHGASPEGWARAVAACAARHGADRVVAEKNQGGSMVESVLRAAEAGLPVRLVHASRGKSARAEPVAMLYEAGKAWHAGIFPELEDELCGLQAGGGYEGPGRSPDRADACVWALTELMLSRRGRAAVRSL